MGEKILIWFIKKGDLILSKIVKQPFPICFSEGDSRKGIISIFAYPDVEIPERVDITENGELRFIAHWCLR